MEHYRKLSIALTDLLAEARALINLRSEFGRLPNSAVKTAALESIEEWFNAESDETKPTKAKANIQYSFSPDAVKTSQGVGYLPPGTYPSMADRVLNDDEVPY